MNGEVKFLRVVRVDVNGEVDFFFENSNIYIYIYLFLYYFF